MRYMQAYRYIFASPNWTMNLLYATLAIFIPVAGQMVMIGYLFEVIEHFHKRGKMEGPETDRYPDFDTNKLMDYLKRGIQPFLAWATFRLPTILAASVLWAIGNIIIAAAGSAIVSMIMFLVMFVVIAAIFVVANSVMVPAYLRAGFTGSFAGAISGPGIKDFLNRVGKETVMASLFLVATWVGLTVVGAIAFCVGAYVGGAVVFMAAHHLDYQLYELYLERGGAPIDMKPPAPIQL
jgi:hypothetical protein